LISEIDWNWIWKKELTNIQSSTVGFKIEKQKEPNLKMLSNKSLICSFVILSSLIYLNQAKPYGGYGAANYGYGFPSMYGGGGYPSNPGWATKPYGGALGGSNLGYGFPNPMGYQNGLMTLGFGNNLNKHKGYMGNSYGGLNSPYGYNRPYGNGLFGFLG